MTGLVEEIQRAALDPNVRVSTLLRQVKLAAVKLNLDSVERWVESELGGYKDSSELPEYRKLSGVAVARGSFGGFEPIILGEGMEWMRIAYVGDAVATLEALIDGEQRGSLLRRYPAKLVASLSKANDAQINEAGCKLQKPSFIRILDAVRNLVLDWAIGLERAGITGNGISFTPEEQRKAHSAPQAITIGSIGSVTGNIGIEVVSGDITNAPVNIDKVRNLVSQVKSNASALTNEGVDSEALTAAIKGIEQQLSAEHPTLLRHALSELEKVVVKASSSLVAQGVLSVLHQILGSGVPGV
jgi:AbiTii